MATRRKIYPGLGIGLVPAPTARQRNSFTPFQANLTPPSGLYDPAIDAQISATQRGYDQTVEDTGTTGRRALQDYELGKTDIGTSYDRGVADLTRSRDRGLADYDTQRKQTTEDHSTAVANLERSYARLGNTQRQAMSARGVLGGGARLQAASKRTANEAIDQAPIDTGFNRAIQGIDTGVSRLGEDFTTSSGRLGENRDRQLGQLGIDYGRQTDDLATGLTRAGTENAQFKIGAGAVAAQQAAQAGWNPYAARPSNEFGSGANARQVITRGNTVYVYGPDGRIISTRRKA